MLPVYLAEMEMQERRAALERALVRRVQLQEAQAAQRHARHPRAILPRRWERALGIRLVRWGERLQHRYTPASKT